VYSAAITQELVLWLIQAGAPPDLIDAGLAIVADELVHSRMSHEVYLAAGGTEPPVIDRAALGLRRRGAPERRSREDQDDGREREALEVDLLRAAVRVFCLGETVAVPLFSHLRAPCTEPAARAALDRILRDEVRHRDFGWDLLDWLVTIVDGAADMVQRELPEMLAELHASYGTGNPVVATDAGEITEDERAWGVAPPREYAAILAETVEKDYRSRFSARGIVLSP
jgi:hypothetical protein